MAPSRNYGGLISASVTAGVAVVAVLQDPLCPGIPSPSTAAAQICVLATSPATSRPRTAFTPQRGPATCGDDGALVHGRPHRRELRGVPSRGVTPALASGDLTAWTGLSRLTSERKAAVAAGVRKLGSRCDDSAMRWQEVHAAVLALPVVLAAEQSNDVRRLMPRTGRVCAARAVEFEWLLRSAWIRSRARRVSASKSLPNKPEDASLAAQVVCSPRMFCMFHRITFHACTLRSESRFIRCACVGARCLRH